MKFRVFKGYRGTRCVRRFDSLDDAKAWCFVHEAPEPHRIEWVEEADEERGIPERRNVVLA